MIYLDNNATTAMDPRVAAVLAEQWAGGPANASSQHQFGRRARGRLEAALDRIGRCLGSDLTRVDAARLIVTSGGTEANNLAINGLVSSVEGSDQAAILVSAIEHPSVLAAAAALQRQGRLVLQINVNAEQRFQFIL